MTIETFSNQFGLIPALDVESIDDLERIVEATHDIQGIVGYKLGLTGSLRLGLRSAVLAIRAYTDLPILYDHQKAGPDMADMAPHFTRVCREAGVDALVLFPVAGPRAVRKFVSHTLTDKMLPVVGGHIPESDYCVSGGGFVVDDVLQRITMIAAEEGTKHFILPANNPHLIQRNIDWINKHIPDAGVFLTGFGPLGGEVAVAFSAAAGCRSRFAIVGRNVTQAASPGEAAQVLIEAMVEAV